ncbi:MAG: AAA family ATPase [Coriobacteriia bacterium]|nr:AAA family ATPase [Coriobacteriia bacterium]
MLERISDLTDKCWVNYSGPEDGFLTKNLIYGMNGSGKSTFSLAISGHAEALFGNPSSVRLFNKEYISTQLFLEDGSGINGVKVNFGEVDVGAAKRIAELVSQLSEMAATKEELAQNHSTLEKRGKDEIERIFSDRKKEANIKRKSKASTLLQLEESWCTDYESALSDFPDANFQDIYGDNQKEKALQRLRSINIKEIEIFSSSEIEYIVAACREVFQDINLPSTEVISWLEDGLRLHEENDVKCQFCGSDELQYLVVAEKLEQYRLAKRAKVESELRRLHPLLCSLAAAVEVIVSLKGSIIDEDGLEELEEHFDLMDALVGEIRPFEDRIIDKVNAMDSSIDFNGTALSELLSQMLSARDKIVGGLKSQIESLENEVNNLDRLVRGAIGFEVKNNAVIVKSKTDLLDVQTKLTETDELIDLLTQERSALEERDSDYADFAQFLDSVLGGLSLPFRLATEEDVYFLTLRTGGEVLSKSDISEGEANLLAMLFFYYSLFQDNKQNILLDEVKVIVIDDPVSSLDSANRFYVLELLRSIMNSGAQAFLLTHSWDEYCDLSYTYKDSDTCAKFEIRKVGGNAHLQKITRRIEMPYKRLFREVYECSQMSSEDASVFEDMHHMPNAMRRVLEEYLRLNSSISTPTASKVQEIGSVLFPGKNWVNEVGSNSKTKTRELLKICNVLSHKPTWPDDNMQVHNSAKFLMARFKDINKPHYDAMRIE